MLLTRKENIVFRATGMVRVCSRHRSDDSVRSLGRSPQGGERIGTPTTEVRMLPAQRLEMTPHMDMFHCTDFRELNKTAFPAVLHLKGTVTGSASEKTTNKGAEQIIFQLLDTNRRSIPCIAHDTGLSLDEFKEGKEVALFYVEVRAGLWNSSGNIWLYDNSYMLTLGQKVLPGVAVEEIFLRGRA